MHKKTIAVYQEEGR